jgi:hypothetical protein
MMNAMYYIKKTSAKKVCYRKLKKILSRQKQGTGIIEL